MNLINRIILITFSVLTSWLYSQECPPVDTLSINSLQNSWNITTENNWEGVEIMTWNIKSFPISNNTINYVDEVITDILPDIIAFQEMNNLSAFNTLANNIPAYEFITSGSGLAIATRKDVIDILNWSTLFPSEGYDFAWRYPMKAEISWFCGTNAITIEVINIHLKSGGSSDDFNRRYNSCQTLSNYIDQNSNTNIIILGDYNDEITESQNNNSLWPLVSNTHVAFATDPIANINYYASYPSWPSFIDHIALSQDLFDEMENSTIQTIRLDDYTGYDFYQNYISDHRPVLWSFQTEQINFTTELVINEIMHNPEVSNDVDGEWIEITNISDTEINLNGFLLHDNDQDMHIISDNNLVIHPDSFIVLGSNANSSLNGGINIDYEYTDFTLSNLWDEVILSHPNGMIIDEVYYDNGETFPDQSGKSMMLTDPILDNMIGGNWAVSDQTFGFGDFGTPNQSNFNDDCDDNSNDINNDSSINILDVVLLTNCILTDSCGEYCSGDMNNDGSYNVLDVVQLVSCILDGNCNI